MVLKQSLTVSDEQLAKQVRVRAFWRRPFCCGFKTWSIAPLVWHGDKCGGAFRIGNSDEALLVMNGGHAMGRSRYVQPSLRPTTATTSVHTNQDADKARRKPSGLGYVNLRSMKTCDTLPGRSPLGMGRKMGCAGLDYLVRVYVYLPQSGDSFYLWVPYNMPVGPPELTLDRFTEMWGFDADARGPCAGKSDSVWEERPRRKSFKEEIMEITGMAVEDQQISAYGATLTTNSAGINYYNVTHGCTVTLSKRESYEARKAAKERIGREPILAVTLARRVKGSSGNATTKALEAAARRLNKTGTGYWIMPKWKHDEYPGLVSKKLMRRSGTLSNDTISYEDYMRKVNLTPGMGHGDPFGAIREAFERHNVITDLPQPSSPRFTHMGIIRNGYETVYNNQYCVTDIQRQKGEQTLGEWREKQMNPEGPRPMTLERSRKLSLSQFLSNGGEVLSSS